MEKSPKEDKFTDAIIEGIMDDTMDDITREKTNFTLDDIMSDIMSDIMNDIMLKKSQYLSHLSLALKFRCGMEHVSKNICWTLIFFNSSYGTNYFDRSFYIQK